MENPPLFQFDQVTVTASSGVRLAAIDCSIPAQGVTAVVGPSGSGKTTLLRLCNRLEVPTSGTVAYRGVPMQELDPLSLRRQVGMVFQKPVLFPGTVRANLVEANEAVEDPSLRKVLARVALDDSFLDRPGDELSGGEAQRVCLARALVASPTALLMDEPTSSLDSAAVQRLEGLAMVLASEGIPIVWVTHDMEQVRRIADHVLVVIEGSLVFAGATGELSLSPNSRVRAFLAASG